MAAPLNMRPGGPRPRYHGEFSLWLLLASAPAAAQIGPLTSQSLLSYQASNIYAGDYLAAEGGVFYTDNVTRSSNRTGSTQLLAGLVGDVSREGAHIDYHLSSNLLVLKYSDGAYPTRPTGYLDGTGLLRIVPGFFAWIVRETYSQVQINLYAPATPDNLESINYITTGPRFTLRPTLRTTVTLDGLYSYLNTSAPSAQYVNFDNHRYGGDLRINRAFSDTSSLYLKGYYEKVEFKDEVNNNNFSYGTATAGYKLTDGRTVLDISGGYSQLRVYDVLTTVESPGGTREKLETQKFEEPIWSVALSRLITPSQRVTLTASQQFADAASSFRLGFDQPVPTIAPPRLAVGEAFKQQLFGVSWRFQAPRTSLDISLVEFRDRYLVNPASNFDSKTANAVLTRQLSPVLRWDIGVSFSHTQQVGAQSENLSPPSSAGVQSAKVFGAITDLRWQLGERLAMRFIYAHSTQSGVYSDNQIGVTASWALIAAQAQTGQPFPGPSPISPASTRRP